MTFAGGCRLPGSSTTCSQRPSKGMDRLPSLFSRPNLPFSRGRHERSEPGHISPDNFPTSSVYRGSGMDEGAEAHALHPNGQPTPPLLHLDGGDGEPRLPE